MSAAPIEHETDAAAMKTAHHDHRPGSTERNAMRRSLKIALLMLAVIGAFYLLREHWDHVAGNWIYLLLLACPLMHLFHGHGGHGGHSAKSDRPSGREG